MTSASVTVDVIRTVQYSTSHTDNMALADNQLTFGLQLVLARVSAHRGDKAVASGEPITQSLTHTQIHTPHSH